MTIVFGNNQHYTPTGPGLLWIIHYGLSRLLEKQRPLDCFSMAHQFNDCNLAPEPSVKPYQYSQCHQICFHWNEALTPTCSYPNCKYQHIYYICVCSRPRHYKCVQQSHPLPSTYKPTINQAFMSSRWIP